MWVLLTIVSASLLDSGLAVCCKSSGIICRDPYTYQLCSSVNNKAQLIGNPRICPEGTICDDEGFFACKVGTVPPTTTPQPATEPPCFGAAKFPTAECNRYYECVSVLFWWEPRLKECPGGQSFDPNLKICAPEASVPCGKISESTTTSTTTTASSITVVQQPSATVPPCFSAEKYATATCNQYYECISVWWWWEPRLKECPDGQNFDSNLKACTSVILIHCGARSSESTSTSTNASSTSHTTTTSSTITTYPVTTTKSPTVPTTTTSTSSFTSTTNNTTAGLPGLQPATEPSCFGAAKFPTTTCNQYYECVSVLWWWEPKLKECPSGQNFDAANKSCASSSLVQCVE